MNTVEIIAGIITLIPMLIGYIMTILSIIKYFQKKNQLLLLSAIIFFSLVSSWIGVTIVFLAAVFNLPPPNDQLYLFSYSWAVPLLATTWNFVTASLFKKKQYLKYIVLGIMGILDVLFIVFIYVLGEYTVETLEGLIYKDSTFLPPASYILYAFVASVLLFICPVYFWVSYRSEQRVIKFKSIMIGIGSALFAIVAVLDGAIPLGNITVVIIIRFVLTIALVLLFLGYNTPIFIVNKLEPPQTKDTTSEMG